ncbi:hypothetical protein [Methanobacterium spitsbergense]|uniref:Uncharacterized protein n=1 Tax=Methanobacterium spitsbergense TaxID=2874285 RepID=A0A8T5V1Y9_9EURY|nr:hypothetical protein [Methanobacterium spitsbergense]MBZ2167063.1 hypothetical protein [Methanobacterium spitsbergense]
MKWNVWILLEIQYEGLVIGMTGDGITDASGHVQSDVGISISAGINIAIEEGNVVLVRSNPLDVVYIIKLT